MTAALLCATMNGRAELDVALATTGVTFDDVVAARFACSNLPGISRFLYPGKPIPEATGINPADVGTVVVCVVVLVEVEVVVVVVVVKTVNVEVT